MPIFLLDNISVFNYSEFSYSRILIMLLLLLLLSRFSHVRLCATPWTAVHQAFLSFTISRSLLKLMYIESVMPSNHLILCHSVLFLPSIFPSIMVFSSDSTLHIRWPKYWSFSLSMSPSKEYSELISFRIDWFDLLNVEYIYTYLNFFSAHPITIRAWKL